MVHDADAGQKLSPAARCSRYLLSSMRRAWQDYLTTPRPSVPHLDTSSDTSFDDLGGTTDDFWDMDDLPGWDSSSDYSSDDSVAESFDDLSSEIPYIWSRGLQYVDDERSDKTLIGTEQHEHGDDRDEYDFI